MNTTRRLPGLTIRRLSGMIQKRGLKATREANQVQKEYLGDISEIGLGITPFEHRD